MGIAQVLRRLDARMTRSAWGSDITKAGVGYPNPGWAPFPGYVTASSSGVTVTEDRANTVAAWFAGVRVISEDIAVAPLHVYRRNGRVTEKATDDPSYRLLHDSPNPEMTSFTFRSTLQSHALAWGNGYAEKEMSGTGRVLALWPLRPDRMDVAWEGGRRVYYYRPAASAQAIRMPSERIFHLPGLGFDGLVGHSVLSLARETLGAAINLRDYGNRVVRNDARPGMVMTHPGSLSEKARENLKRGWREANEREGAGRTALLEEGIKLETFGFPPEDVQFLESQAWQVTEVARWLRLSPHKLSDLSRATFSNIEEQNLDHVTSTLRAWFVRWEQQLNKDVVPPGLFCEHNLDAQLRGRTLERAQAWVAKIGIGAAVPNEWRESDNQNPLDWGDDRVSTPNNAAPPPPTEAPKAADVHVHMPVNAPPEVKVDGPTIASVHVDEAVGATIVDGMSTVAAVLSDDIDRKGESLRMALDRNADDIRRQMAIDREEQRKAVAAVAAAAAIKRQTHTVERDAANRIVAIVVQHGDQTIRKTVHRDDAGRVLSIVEDDVA